MRNSLSITVALALTLMAASAPAGAASEQFRVTVDCSELRENRHLSRQVRASAGDLVIVTLCSGPSTRAGWPETAQISDTTVLLQTDHEFIPPKSRQRSATGKARWTFRAVGNGTVRVSLRYRSEPGSHVLDWSFDLTVVVKREGPLVGSPAPTSPRPSTPSTPKPEALPQPPPPPPPKRPPETSPPPPREEIPPPVVEGPESPPTVSAPPREANLEVVSVFYGTDRLRTENPEPHLIYGDDCGPKDVVELGVCEVSIPPSHKVGKLESPFAVWSLVGLGRWAQNPARHVLLRSVEPMHAGRFVEELRERIARSDRREAFVFIHGYNVSFEDACRRTAQLAYDLEFPGAPILFSWPSDGSLMSYTQDMAAVQWTWTQGHLQDFLKLVTDRTGAERVHLIAHSMGSRAMVRAVNELALERAGRPGAPMFSEIVLAAADIDTDTFLALSQNLKQVSERMTIYASSNDKALKLSAELAGRPRLGDSGTNLVVIDGIDTIDASTVKTSFLEHSYYGEGESVLADLYEILHGRTPASARSFIRQVVSGDKSVYYVFGSTN